MLRPATPLTILLLGAFGLLVLSVISTPIIRIIPLASFAGIDFGVFGFCKADQCSPIELGYDTSNLFDDAQSSTFNLPSSTRATLSIILIVHPIAAFLTFTMLILAASAHFHSPSHSPRYLLGIFILSILTLLASLLSFLIDVLLFVPHMQWGSYLVLAATVLITVSGIISCAMRRTLVSRKARKKRIAKNAEMNGENFYNRQGPRTTMLPVATGPLASGALGEEKPNFATFDSTKRVNNLETVSDERIPLTRRTTVQSSSSIPAPIGNSNILSQRDDFPLKSQTNNILPRTSHSQSESNNLRPYEQPIIRQFSGNGGVPGSFGGTRGVPRGGFQGRGCGAFDPGRGDFRSGRGGFVPGRGGFVPGRGGFVPGRGGFVPGRGGFAPGRGGFAPGRGGFVSGRGDYMPARGGYGLNRSDYQASRGNYHGPSREILNTERTQGRNLGPSQVGTYQSKPYYDMSQLPSAQPAYDIYSPVSPTEYSAYNPNTSDESLPRAESPPLTDFEPFIDEPKINPNPGAPQQPYKKSEVARNLRPNGVDFPGTPYTKSQDALQESIVSRENSITNADMSFSSPRLDWETNGQQKISNSPAKSTTATLKSTTSEYRQIPLEKNYFQAANPNQINQPLTPAPLAPRPTKPIVGIETKFGLNIDSYYDEFGLGARSPADSDISNFTSVSQRGVNPRWNDEVHNGLRQVTPQRDPAQQKKDLLFNGNPDFALPVKTTRGIGA